jgi:dsDNA-specific endonuclease/ATPase MutS2
MRAYRKEDKRKRGITFNMLTEIAEILTELERMHQLNYELLEQLNVVFRYIRENNIPIPHKEKLASLLSKAMTLLAEIQTKSPKCINYPSIADENLQRKRTDGDFTESAMGSCTNSR